jgi:hypothetical protein
MSLAGIQVEQDNDEPSVPFIMNIGRGGTQPGSVFSAKAAQRSYALSFRPLRQAQDKLREKSFLDPSHSLGMTVSPVTWRPFDLAQDMLCAFAGKFSSELPLHASRSSDSFP